MRPNVNNATSDKLATMATHEGNSLVRGMIEKPPVERDTDMAEAGVTSCTAVRWSEKTTRVSFAAASEQWQLNKYGKTLRNETLEPLSALGDWRSQIDQTVRQHVCEVTQLHQMIDRMARMLEEHAAREEAQWLGMKEWLEDSETKWMSATRTMYYGGRASRT
jgi:hypothetical protein